MSDTDAPRTEKTFLSDVLLQTDQKAAIIHRIILNKGLQIGCVLLICGLVIPSICYLIFYSREFYGYDVFTAKPLVCSHSEKHHIKCGSINISVDLCSQIGCCFSPLSGCFHSMPSRYQYYSLSTESSHAYFFRASLKPGNLITPFGTPSSMLNVFMQNANTRRLIVAVGTSTQEIGNYTEAQEIFSPLYEYTFDPNFFAINIRAKDTNRLLLSTARGTFIASPHYFEWSFYLGTSLLYGFGEYAITKKPFKKLLLRSGSAENNFLPFIIARVTVGTKDHFHAITFDVDGPMEIEITRSSLVIIRTLSNEKFRFHLIVGESFKSLLEELSSKNENATTIPYWAFGVHVCGNSKTTGNLSLDMQEFLAVNRMAFDSHCIDDMALFDKSKDIPAAIDILKSHGKKIILSAYPHIRHLNDSSMNVPNSLLLRNSSNDIYIGQLANEAVVYANWNNSHSNDLINGEISYIANLDVDGIFIENNCFRDDSVDVFRSLNEEVFRYLPDKLTTILSSLAPATLRPARTKNWILKQLNRQPIQYLNAFRSSELEKKFLISTIYDFDSRIAGESQGYPSTWHGLKMAMNNLLSNALVDFRFSGSEVCGNSTEIIDEELCVRWYQLAAVMPIFRIDVNKMLGKFSGLTQLQMIEAIELRYSLLTYFYTMTILNQPFIRPMFYEFSTSVNNEEYQFLLGSALMVVPILVANQTYTEKTIYFPDKYFDFRFGFAILDIGMVKYPVYESPLQIFIRSGHVVPIHDSEGSYSSNESRLKPMTLIAALNCSNEESRNCQADGILAISTDLSWRFTVDEEKLRVIPLSTTSNLELWCSGQPEMTSKINKIRIYGHSKGSVVEETVNANICTTETVIIHFQELRNPIKKTN